MTTNLDTLRVDALHSTPVDYDWSDTDAIMHERWQSFEAVRCSDLYTPDPDEEGCDTVSIEPECPTCGRDFSDYQEGPMMNYYYPLPRSPRDVGDDWGAMDLSVDQIAEALIDLPLCLVRVEVGGRDVWGLALTGGGMDLSWEICAAFMAVGFLPPLHFIAPPQMAEVMNDRKRVVIAACRASVEAARTQLDYKVTDLDSLEAWHQEREAAR